MAATLIQHSTFNIQNNPVILFDGVCNLCNSTVQFILRKDKKKQFVFGSIQGKSGQELMREYNLPLDTMGSFILIENGIAYTRSTGALKVLKLLGWPWKSSYAFIIIPAFIRNFIYDFIARNRYRWFGKQDACWLPTPELKNRFLD